MKVRPRGEETVDLYHAISASKTKLLITTIVIASVTIQMPSSMPLTAGEPWNQVTFYVLCCGGSRNNI